MFVLAQIQDIVRVAPTEFRKDSESAILAVLNRKYANHVLHQVGLCIEANDITSSTDFLVHACQDGAYQSTIVFNLVVFRPFIGQVLMGRIKNSSPVLGIQVSVEFFDDIFIPPEFLMPGTVL